MAEENNTGINNELNLTGWEAKQLKGCVFSPPSLLPVPGRGKEVRKRNLSIASNPVSVTTYDISLGIISFSAKEDFSELHHWRVTLTTLLLGGIFLQVTYQLASESTMPHTCIALAFGLILYAWIKDYMENYVDVDGSNI